MNILLSTKERGRQILVQNGLWIDHGYMILKRVWYANGAVNIVIVVLVILNQVLLRVVHEESKMHVRSIQIKELTGNFLGRSTSSSFPTY